MKNQFVKTTQEVSGDWNEWIKMQRTDHDTLIRVEALMNGLVSDVKDLKDGTAARLIEHETRLRSLEKIADEYKPGPLVNQLMENTNNIRDMRTSKNTVFLVASVVGGIIAFLFMVVSNVLGIIRFGR